MRAWTSFRRENFLKYHFSLIWGRWFRIWREKIFWTQGWLRNGLQMAKRCTVKNFFCEKLIYFYLKHFKIAFYSNLRSLDWKLIQMGNYFIFLAIYRWNLIEKTLISLKKSFLTQGWLRDGPQFKYIWTLWKCSLNYQIFIVYNSDSQTMCRGEIENVPKKFLLNKALFQFFVLLDSQRINQASIIYRDHKSDYP